MSVFAQYAPYELADGDWDARRDEIGELILDAIAVHAPDVHDCVEHVEVLGPPDIEERIGLTGGNIFQGEALPDQMWDRRLRPPDPGRGPLPVRRGDPPGRLGDRAQRPQRRDGRARGSAPAAEPTGHRPRAAAGPRLITRVGPIATPGPTARGCVRRARARGRLASIAREDRLAAQVPASLGPRGRAAASGRRARRPRDTPRASAAASSSVRSKLQSQGVTGTPAPRPKNATPSISAPSPCSTVGRVPAPAGLAEGVLGLVVAGDEDRGRRRSRAGRSIVSSSPSCTEAKSPTPTTTSASALMRDQALRLARSVWRSLKASSFTGRAYPIHRASTHEPQWDCARRVRDVSEFLRV